MMKSRTRAFLFLLAASLVHGETRAALPQRPEVERAANAINPALLPDGQGEHDGRDTPVVRAVRRAADSVVSIYLVESRSSSADGQGSGVILDETGLVITNWHVVYPATQSSTYRVQVRLRDQRQHMAQLLSVSPDDDLALLQLELDPGETVQPIALGDSSDLMIGETVVAIGNPRGHANTVTAGVLSAEDRSINVRTPDGRVRQFDGLLQTDAAINQGNSGGALLDITGKLIGINNAMAMSAENIGFAIPVNTVKEVFHDKLLSAENLAAVWLGMRVVDHEGQLVVTDVHPVGPAARAGVIEGDHLVGAAGRTIGTELDYARQVLQATPGLGFPLAVERSGRTLQLAPVPLSQVEYELVRRIGVEVESVAYEDDPELVRRASLAFYGTGFRRVPALPGLVRIVRVYPDSPAADLEAKPGDILLGSTARDMWGDYREVPFVSDTDLANKLRLNGGRTITIIVLRDDKVLDGKLRIQG